MFNWILLLVALGIILLGATFLPTAWSGSARR